MIEGQPWGKFYLKAFTGSLKTKGAVAFALMAYAVSAAKPPNGIVEMDPDLMAYLIGETKERILAGMDILMGPDPDSRCKAEEGRRLFRVEGNYYRLVNWLAHRNQKIVDVGSKREYWRRKTAESRARKVNKSFPKEQKPSSFLETGATAEEWHREIESNKTAGSLGADAEF